MPDFGGLDPTIPLGVHGAVPAQQGGEAAFGPLNNVLGIVGKQAEITNAQNQAKLFQQQFAAKQRAGEIMASAPSTEAGLQALTKDPIAGPFAGEYVMQMREAQMTQAQLGLIATQQQGAVQEQSLNGYHAVIQGLAGAADDPSTLGSTVDAYLKTLSPQARARVAPAVAGVVKSLTEGLPDDPALAHDQFKSRIMGLAIASGGLAPDTARALTGQLAPQVTTITGPGGEKSQQIIGGPATSSPDYLNNGVTGVTAYDPENPLVGAPGSAGNALGGLAAPPPAASNPRVLGTGPTTEQDKINEAQGAAGGSVQSDMTDIAATIPLQLSRMNQIVDTLTKFQAGGFADIRTEGGKLLQGLRNAGINIPDSIVQKVANGSLPSSQEFTGLAKQLATQQLSIYAKGQGRVLAPEVDAALKQIDQTQDPAAIIAILNNIRKQYQISSDMSTKFLGYKRELAKPLAAQDSSIRGLHQADFYQWYKEQFDPETLPTFAGKLNVGPIPPGVALGSQPPGMPDFNTWAAQQLKFGRPATPRDYAAAVQAFQPPSAAASPTGRAAPDLNQFHKQ